MWAACLLVGLVATAPAIDPAPSSNATDVEIVGLVPNTVNPYNAGEFFAVHVPRRTNLTGWVFRDDGPQRAKPPPVTVQGTVAFSHDPETAQRYTDLPVYELAEGHLQLAVAGDALAVEADGQVLDRVAYEGRAPTMEWYLPAGEEPWRPVGATALDPVSAVGETRVFTLPDSPTVASSAIDAASERVYLGGYTFGDPAVTAALIDAHERGVRVAVHGEGRPVGGLGEATSDALDRLAAAGVNVTVHDGEHARWGYHHAKYAVIDDRVLVLTENFNPSGTGGQTSRGWGAIVNAPALAGATAELFEAETSWYDARPWAGDGAAPADPPDPPPPAFPTVHEPLAINATEATLVVGPDHAESYLRDVIADAEHSIDVKQVRIGNLSFPLLEGVLERARAGVSVRILLSGDRYVGEENRRLADELEAIADAEDLDLDVALAADTPRFERIHAKGVIVDGESVFLGSHNWNNHSFRENREVALHLEDERVAAHFTAVFEGDWPGPTTWRLPLGLVVATAGMAAVVTYHARGIPVEGPTAATEERYTEGPD